MALETEKQAGKKWCPFTFAATSGAFTGPGPGVCRGSYCMAWEWFSSEDEGKPDRRGYCRLIDRT